MGQLFVVVAVAAAAVFVVVFACLVFYSLSAAFLLFPVVGLLCLFVGWLLEQPEYYIIILIY